MIEIKKQPPQDCPAGSADFFCVKGLNYIITEGSHAVFTIERDPTTALENSNIIFWNAEGKPDDFFGVLITEAEPGDLPTVTVNCTPNELKRQLLSHSIIESQFEIEVTGNLLKFTARQKRDRRENVNNDIGVFFSTNGLVFKNAESYGSTRKIELDYKIVCIPKYKRDGQTFFLPEIINDPDTNGETIFEISEIFKGIFFKKNIPDLLSSEFQYFDKSILPVTFGFADIYAGLADFPIRRKTVFSNDFFLYDLQLEASQTKIPTFLTRLNGKITTWRNLPQPLTVVHYGGILTASLTLFFNDHTTETRQIANTEAEKGIYCLIVNPSELENVYKYAVTVLSNSTTIAERSFLLTTKPRFANAFLYRNRAGGYDILHCATPLKHTIERSIDEIVNKTGIATTETNRKNIYETATVPLTAKQSEQFADAFESTHVFLINDDFSLERVEFLETKIELSKQDQGVAPVPITYRYSHDKY